MVKMSTTKTWPSKVAAEDDLYAIVDGKSKEVKALVFASSEKNVTLVRDTGIWFDMTDEFVDFMDDPDFYNQPVTPAFVKYYDENMASNARVKYSDEFSDLSRDGMKPVTAAVSADCPEATQDIAVNLRNRKKAIDAAMYGPLNPAEPNVDYWSNIAEEWGVEPETAMNQRCGNCAMFIVTSNMKNCIEAGVTGGERPDEFDSIDAAGELGYCEAFDFKCASARTCRAWVVGGPITDDIK